jgi:ABC-2 type transport system permease protein
MRNILTITRRELASYFNSAIAYIYLIVFIAINNGLFMMQYFVNARADMAGFFDSLPLVLVIFIPAITMRLWAEDKRENTFEMLLTFPMKPYQLVIGKFFASLIFYAIALASTLTIPLIVRLTGTPDSGAIIGGYLGSFLIGVVFLSVGIFISGLASEQIVAFVLTALTCFGLFFLGTEFFATFIDGWVAGLGTFLKKYIGAAVHYSNFSKGIINIWDIAYFAVTASIFLMLNGFYLEGRLRPKSKMVFAGAVCTCVAGIICLNWLLGDMAVGRFDITENKLYTVSDGSKRIMKGLKVPVSVSFYVTPADKMPTSFKTIEKDIAGKLEELKLNSQGKFNYRVFHIEASKLMEKPDAATGQGGAAGSLENTLQEKGIVPFQVESIDKDAVGLKLVYAAMTISYKENNDEVLPRLMPQNLPDLEYMLFSRIAKLTREEKPKIAVYAPLKKNDNPLMRVGSEDQKEDQYKDLVPLMVNNGYDARRTTISETDPLPEQANILLVLNPGSLNSRQLFEINKFLYHGGTVMIAAQGYEYQFEIAGSNGVKVAAQKLPLEINKLINAWGISINEDMLLDENTQIIQINTGRVGPFAMSIPIKIPNQIAIAPENFNGSSDLLSRLPSLLYLWGSSLDISDDIIKQGGVKKTLLFTSGKRSWKAPYKGGQLTQEQLTYPGDSKGKFPLAVVLQGQFTNTFKDAAMPEWPKANAEAAAQPSAQPSTQSKAEMTDGKPGKLLVVGCSRMFSDDLLPNAGNLGFFSNVIDSAALGDDILSIRAKTFANRTLRAVSDNQKIFYRFLTIFLVPLVLIAFAGLRLFLRRREKQFYVAARER